MVNDLSTPILPLNRAIIIIGNYGSGKSEVAVNWTIAMKNWGINQISIADLDIVNPYFRSREAIKVMEEKGINVVAPKGRHFYADLPIILPEIKGLFQNQEGYAVFDVGGEDVGAKLLSSFHGFITDYELLVVVNSNRPFTNTLENTKILKHKMENAAGLRITGFIGNTHLMDETDVDTILKGAAFLSELSEATDIPVRFITAHTSLYEKVMEAKPKVPVLPVERILSPPWYEGMDTTHGKAGPSVRI